MDPFLNWHHHLVMENQVSLLDPRPNLLSCMDKKEPHIIDGALLTGLGSWSLNSFSLSDRRDIF